MSAPADDRLTRRALLARGGALALLPALGPACARPSRATPRRRVRPSDPGWPDAASWAALSRRVGGRLVPVRSPLAACVADPRSPACGELFRRLRNPYYLGDEVGLTQTLGWVGAWTSQPSAYAVAAASTADVVAAVNFARERRLRLVVKGGGHGYLGTSTAPDSLLIWTRPMRAITLHEAFVPAGCAERQAPRPAVTVEAGAIWMQAYQAVTTRGGRYVQGGGCTTVGVAGLVQSGGFGSFSKRYGLAAARLLQAEVVTADGVARTVNACAEPELFWGLKGGGGGSLGVVTRLTLETRELPDFFGAFNLTIRAASDAAFRRLIEQTLGFYAARLFNPHWGEQIALRGGNLLQIRMVFQGLDQRGAEAVWRPLLDWVAAAPGDYALAEPPLVLAVPARRLWDPALLRQVPGVVAADDRPGAPADNVFWAANVGEAGQVIHGYQSAWLPAALLSETARPRLAEALFRASRHRGLALHLNKGLAGAPAEEVAAARDTAMNPAVLDAFALLICAATAPPAYPGVAGREPDAAAARAEAAAIERALREVRALVPEAGSYVAESDFFEPDWARAYWGANYPRLLAVKDRYDPEGLFFVHHGVGSERWSADGFTRLG
jgi:FAD/FMN-containing dehydrogenase